MVAGIIAAHLLIAAQAAAVQTAAPSVALVTEVKGDVRLAGGKPLARLTWLAEGARVETAKDAHAIVVFWNGERWRIDSGSRARILDAGVIRMSGGVQQLESFPPLPHLPPIAPASARSSTYGAVRLRGGYWALLYPRSGTRSLLASSTLTFEPRQSGGPYRVEVIDPSGAIIFETETRETRVTVPAERLKPGTRYTWMVRLPSTPGVDAGAGEFTTLDRETEAARRAFHAAHTTRDAATLAMLAEIDLALGLLPEARKGFEDALALSPDDASMRARAGELRAARVPVAGYLKE